MPKPKKTEKLFSQELLKIFSLASKNKIYGSVEVFFEAGNITQITQRIINKLSSYKNKQSQKSSSKKARLLSPTIEKPVPKTHSSNPTDTPTPTRTP